MPGCSIRQWSARRFERDLRDLVDAQSAPRRGVRRAGRRHVDDVARRLLEVRERGLADVAGADDVGRERRRPLLGRRVRHPDDRPDRGGVDHRVDAAHRRGRLVERGLGGGLVDHVALDGDGVVARLLRRFLDLLEPTPPAA